MEARGRWPWIYILLCIIGRVRSPITYSPSIEDFKRRALFPNTQWWSATGTNARRHLAHDAIPHLFIGWPWRWSSVSSPFDANVPPSTFWNIGQTQPRMMMPIHSANQLHSNMLKPQTWTRQARRLDLEGNMFSRYLTLKEIYDYLDKLAATYANLVTVEEIGRTFEGRPIKLVRISGKSSPNLPKPAIWIDAGIHPREWISISTALYLIDQLVIGAEYPNDPVIKDLVGRYEWYILPIVNPDGYDYTWTTDRMWRKNRVWYSSSPCRGVDLNRNFDFYFKSSPTHSSNSNSCHEKYPGQNPFSEAETAAILNRTTSLRPSLVAFISMHSYDQLWMVPYGPTVRRPKHYTKMISMAKVAADAIKRTSGKRYRVGSIAQLSGLVGGGSVDWAYEALSVQYSFAVELRDTGRSGFLLPPSQIIPTGREMWAAILAVAERIAKEMTPFRVHSIAKLTKLF